MLYLMRHGESLWNVERRLQGQTMWVPLTETGVTQAEAAAESLAGLGVVAVVSSDQERAARTARIVAERVGVPLRLTPELREQGLGELEGRSLDDLVPEDTPEGVDITEVRWGGGESVADVHARLRGFVAALREEFTAEDDVVLVSHGDTLRVLLAVLAGRGYREVDWDDAFGNGEIRGVEWRATVSP